MAQPKSCFARSLDNGKYILRAVWEGRRIPKTKGSALHSDG